VLRESTDIRTRDSMKYIEFFGEKRIMAVLGVGTIDFTREMILCAMCGMKLVGAFRQK